MRFAARGRIGLAVGLLIAVAACTATATPAPPTRTPRPTITPTRTEAATRAPTTAASPTAAIASTRTPVVAATVEAALPLLTATAASTVTRPAVIIRPTIAPLEITNILLIRVERDPTRENGAIAFLQVVYAGGRGPYQIFHDDTLQPDNPFGVLTLCNGTIVHTLRVTSRDGQATTKKYYLSPIECPPN